MWRVIIESGNPTAMYTRLSYRRLVPHEVQALPDSWLCGSYTESEQLVETLTQPRAFRTAVEWFANLSNRECVRHRRIYEDVWLAALELDTRRARRKPSRSILLSNRSVPRIASRISEALVTRRKSQTLERVCWMRALCPACSRTGRYSRREARGHVEANTAQNRRYGTNGYWNRGASKTGRPVASPVL